MRLRSSVDGDAMRPYAKVGLLIVSAIVAGCATAIDESETAAKAAATLKASFRPAGQAGLDRLEQDETQRACSLAAGNGPSKEVAATIERANLAAIRYPADGKLLGDWKNGEKIAQEGRGKQFSDDPKGPVGANCYACHQLSKAEPHPLLNHPRHIAFRNVLENVDRDERVEGIGLGIGNRRQ